MTKRTGRLIVIDGADGSGKATQTKLVSLALKKEGYKVKTIDFPRYDSNLFGSLLYRLLHGEMGDFISYDPRVASALYAADRFESSPKIRSWLDDGCVVICDRYVSANQIHQGGKIHDDKKREDFFKWLDKMEYGVFKLPKPDLIVYLSVDFDVSTKLLDRRVGTKKKGVLVGKKDLAESNKKYLLDSRESALLMVKKSNKWVKVECAPEGGLLPKTVVRDLIIARIKKVLPKLK